MTGTGCPKPLELVTYFLGEESGENPIAGHVRVCAACAAQIRELETERKAFLVKHPFSSFAADLEKRRASKTSGFGAFLKHIMTSGAFHAAVAMAGVAALMIVVIGRYDRAPEILSKGG